QRQQLCQSVLQVPIPNRRSEVVAREQQLSNDFLPEKQALIGVHQFALPYCGAGLHAWDAGWPFSQLQARDARGNRSRSDNQVLILGPIKLVHHAAQQIDIDLPVGSNEAGADFDDYSHVFLVRAISRCRESPRGGCCPGGTTTLTFRSNWPSCKSHSNFCPVPTGTSGSSFESRNNIVITPD